MRKTAPLTLSLVMILGIVGMASPASARSKRRHHHRHHHHTPAAPSTPVCGPGTVLVTALNQCVQYPFPSNFLNPGTGSGGISSGGITISPSVVSLTPLTPPVAGKGTFISTFTMSGLPPLTTFTVSGGDANCPMTGGGTFATTATSTSITFTLANTTPGTPCQQGAHPVTAASATTPFTAFVTFTS